MPATGPPACVRAYRPRAAEHTVLHQIVRTHLATFLRATEEGGGVPPFVEREVRQFITCGVWARGFVATIEDPPVAQRILRHLGLPTETPVAAPARPPPGPGSNLAFDFPS